MSAETEIRLDADSEMLVQDGFHMAMPLTVCVADAGAVITVFPSLKRVGEEMAIRFGDRLTSAEAAAWAREKCTHFLSGYGFETESCAASKTDVYTLSPDASDVLKTTRKITDADGLEDLTDTDFQALNACGHWAFGTVVDGKILSVAATGCPLRECGEIDIGVETAEKYRGHGYARSNAAALALAILAGGKLPLYEVEDDNPASIALAKRLGGRLLESRLYVIGEK